MSQDTYSIEKWMQQASTIQAQLIEARSRLMEAEVAGISGDVTVSLGANGDLRDIRIDRDVVDDVAQLRRDIMAAHERANLAVREMAEDIMRPVQNLVGDMESLE
jgi:DNA-binding protein YbaB